MVVLPNTKRFEVHEVRRVPCSISPEAREELASTHEQGRLFPQALQEVFGLYPEVSALELHAEPKRMYFPVHPDEHVPGTHAEPFLLHITVHSDALASPFTLHLNTASLKEQPHVHHTPTTQPTFYHGFQARASAEEMGRLYELYCRYE